MALGVAVVDGLVVGRLAVLELYHARLVGLGIKAEVGGALAIGVIQLCLFELSVASFESWDEIDQVFSSVSARVQNLHHVLVFVHSKSTFQPLVDLISLFAVLDIVVEIL